MSEQLQSTYSLAEDLDSSIVYEEAGLGKRFLNYFIDNLLMRFALSYVTGTLLGLFLYSLDPTWANSMVDETNFSFWVLAYILGVFNYLLYYTFCEKVFKGYTLGKLITGSRAVREDGQELRFKDALIRSLIRVIPFEPLSAFGGRPWHDTWSNTRVIKVR